jgi:hypothetical protein
MELHVGGDQHFEQFQHFTTPFAMTQLPSVRDSQAQTAAFEMTPHTAHEFLRSTPRSVDDLLLSEIIAAAGKLPELDLAAMSKLHLPGPKSAAQLYSIFSSRLHFEGMQSCVSLVCSGARSGELRVLDLANLAVRRLLLEEGIFEQSLRIYMQQHFPCNRRESLHEGQGIWLGVNAKVIHLKYALRDVLDHCRLTGEEIGLVLLSPDATANAELLSIAREFPNSVFIRYSDEVSLVESLRRLKMRVFIEMHGFQNPDSFVEKLQTGVANVQLSWVGLPEGCAIPFIDGQLLDPFLAKSEDVVCPAIALNCWLPPTKHFPRMVRGEALGLWTLPQKLSERFLTFCSELAARCGRKLQILSGARTSQLRVLPPHIEVISDVSQFRPAVLLDSTPISGGNACLFALLSGIPVVTMPGDTVSSRLGASVLLHYGFPEGIVDNLSQYEQRVLEFCKLHHMPKIHNEIDWKFTETIERFLAA